MFDEGRLVRCLDTGKVGVVVETKMLSHMTMVLVQWPDKELWTESDNLERIETF